VDLSDFGCAVCARNRHLAADADVAFHTASARSNHASEFHPAHTITAVRNKDLLIRGNRDDRLTAAGELH